jgi:hypothetical protein
MMIQYILLLNLLNLFSYINASSSSSNMNFHGLRKLGFKYIIFKKKEYPKMLDSLRNQYQIYYEKSIGIISDCMCEYDKLSNEDKIIIDFIISNLL